MSKFNREVICVHSGQAGVQLGNALWELLANEHDISPSGTLRAPDNDSTAFQTFFSCSSQEHFFPRSLIFDSEPTVIDEIRTGLYKHLFHPELLVTGCEDAANNFARGYYSESKRLMSNLVDKLRSIIEHCDNLQGFVVQSGIAGGTGSGILAVLLEHINMEFAGRSIVQLSILPGKKLSNCIVQPYNCVLMMDKMIYNADINILVDNETAYDICLYRFGNEKPTFTNVNRIVSPLLSNLTAPLRFKGLIHSDLIDISTNLIPYPRLHFPFASYGPMVSSDRLEHDIVNTEYVVRSIFHASNQFIELDLKNGFFMASAIILRGNCDLSNVMRTIREIKCARNLRWVSWCPTGFKISHTVQPSLSIPGQGQQLFDKSAMMISNHNGIVSTFEGLESNFRKLYVSKSYIHWYIGEGMDESEFGNSLYEVDTISDDYSSIVEDSFATKFIIAEKTDTSPKVTSLSPTDAQNQQGSGKSIETLHIDDQYKNKSTQKGMIKKTESSLAETLTGNSFDAQTIPSRKGSETKLKKSTRNNPNNSNVLMVETSPIETSPTENTRNVRKLFNNNLNSNLNSNLHIITSSGDSVISENNQEELLELDRKRISNSQFLTLKKNIFIQKSISKKSNSNLFKEIYKKNKKFINKLMHAEEYNISKF